MTNEQIIDLIIITINVLLAAFALAAAYKKLPATYQGLVDQMQVLSSKSLKVIGFIVLLGAFVQIIRHAYTY